MAINDLDAPNDMVKSATQSYVLDMVVGVLSSIVGNFIYDKLKALDWNRITPLLVNAAIRLIIFVSAAGVALLMIFYLPLAP